MITTDDLLFTFFGGVLFGFLLAVLGVIIVLKKDR